MPDTPRRSYMRESRVPCGSRKGCDTWLGSSASSVSDTPTDSYGRKWKRCDSVAPLYVSSLGTDTGVSAPSLFIRADPFEVMAFRHVRTMPSRDFGRPAVGSNLH